MKANKLRIAVQKEGRLREPSLNFLESSGLRFARENSRALITPCQNVGIEILYVRHRDIPQYVQSGAADVGIVGENIIYEDNPQIKVAKRLGFGKCSLVVAAPKNSAIKTVFDLEGERIATSYPNSLKRFLQQKKITASIIEIRGSVEITTSLNIADAICDLVQTGKTFEENGLVQIEKVLDSEAVLIQNPNKRTEEINIFQF